MQQFNFGATGLQGVEPRLVYGITDANLATVTSAGWISPSAVSPNIVQPTDWFAIRYGISDSAPGGTFDFFLPTISNGVITLAQQNGTGDVTYTGSLTAGHAAIWNNTTGTLEDAGAAPILVSSSAGQVVATSLSSATPGTVRALTGAMTETATTMTSGNVVGLRGSVTNVGASGGFIYGVQGKVISTGTLSGSSWTASVFGQLDISAATINAGQTAAIWGDYGTSSGTITSATGMRGVAMTNTTAAVLNAQDYRYGNATYLLELAGAGGTLNYYAAAGTSAGSAGDATHCAAQQVIAVQINGVAAYIPVFTQNT